jgi:protein involved in polysaccharide export with SLBB domain
MRHLFCLFLFLLGGLFASGAEQRFRDGDIFRLAIGGPPRIYTADFELEYTVDGGTVTLPILGRIRAVDLTQSQLAADIEKRLKDGKIFTSPNVIISLQRALATIVVGGAVRNPGRHPWVADMTLTQAIASAAGRSDFAKDTVKIVRGGKAVPFSFKAIKKDPGQDPKILIGDFIDVDGDF